MNKTACKNVVFLEIDLARHDGTGLFDVREWPGLQGNVLVSDKVPANVATSYICVLNGMLDKR